MLNLWRQMRFERVNQYLRKSATPYLSGIFTSYVVALFAQYMWPTKVVFLSQNLSLILLFCGMAICTALWLLYVPSGHWSSDFWWITGAWASLWAVSMMLSIVHRDLFSLTAILTPISLALLAVKRPSLLSSLRAGDIFVCLLIGVALLSQFFVVVDVKTPEFQSWNRWPFVFDIVGPLGRWSGPFGNVNYAGPIGASMFTFGLIRFGWKRAIFCGAGAVFVFLSDSRNAMFMLMVGLGVFVALSPRNDSHWRLKWLRTVPLATVVTAAIVYVLSFDPTLNGRTPVWRVFVELWQTSPIIGVGGTGISSAIEQGSLQAWANHGHNILFDSATRFGVFGVMALSALILVVGVAVVRSFRRGFRDPTILFAVFVAGGVSDNLVDWKYVGIHAVPLVLTAILAAVWLSEQKQNSRPPYVLESKSTERWIQDRVD